MENATVKNDRDFPVEITVKNEDGEEVKRTLAPGEETEVPKDQSEDVLAAITDATNPDEDGDGSDNDEDKDKDGEDGNDSNLSESERKELSDLRQKQALADTEREFNTLLSANKVTPAQKEAFMALAEVRTSTVSLSGKQVSLSTLVTQILEAGPNVSKFSEDGSSNDGDGSDGGDGNGSDNSNKKPSETLSEEERKGMQATGADPKRMDELADKYPEMQSALQSNQTENK